MLKRIKNKEVFAFLKERIPFSHKGDHGHLLIVGGSLDYYGAPIISGIGAFRSGVDLVTLLVPEAIFDVCRNYYPDFIVRKYPGEYLTERYVDDVLEYSKKCNAMVLGPGLGDHPKTLDSCMDIIQKANLPIVVDANAISVLKRIKKFPLPINIVATPHMNEFRNLVDRDLLIDENDPKSIVFLRSIAMDLNLNILLKGRLDYCVSEDGEVFVNETGNTGMTVGGSGDFLAGVVGSLLAQKYDSFEAIQIASYFVGKAGDQCFKKFGNGLIASDLGKELSKVMKKRGNNFFGLRRGV